MAEEKKQSKFKVGDRVIGVAGFNIHSGIYDSILSFPEGKRKYKKSGAY